MLKTFFIKIFPLIIPLLIFILWFVIEKKIKKNNPDLKEAPYFLMVLSAVLTFFFAIIGFRIISQENINTIYVPPSYEDGNVIPGRFDEK